MREGYVLISMKKRGLVGRLSDELLGSFEAVQIMLFSLKQKITLSLYIYI